VARVKRWIAAVGILAFALLITYQVSQTSAFIQCESALASSYVDDLNPDFAERVTTSFSCAGHVVNNNQMVLGFGTHTVALVSLVSIFVLLLGFWLKSRSRDNIPPSPKPIHRWASALNPPPIERKAVSAPSVIGSTVKMSGSFVSNGDFHVDGFIDADIVCSSLVIAECGQVHGRVTAERVIIRGRFKGRINAEKIVLCSSSEVEGNLTQKSLEVELGAHFNGDCRYFALPAEPTIHLTSQAALILANKSSVVVEAV
jgi:cytoskeletal protein CcmA (bactofilin family)